MPLLPHSPSRQLQRFEPWRCRGAGGGTGAARGTAAQGRCSGCFQVPVANSGVSQHQNWEASAFQGGGHSFIRVGTALLGTAPLRPHPARLLELPSGSSKAPGSGRRCRQERCGAHGAGRCRGVLPAPAAPTACIHSSPAHPPWRREGRSGLTATHGARHRAKEASPVSPKPSAVPVASEAPRSVATAAR